ncbi:hypothetical protein [Bacillus nakamurai]|uniref:hypothetical protein n=1 Tax=Bacillus nakamurai TaxID=1793963 RepID=UPI0020C447E4|nr:hypothetical protein [Bacillus nakamurai]MCP6682101.1 hypothetical protein [Bacillus nakamurai]
MVTEKFIKNEHLNFIKKQIALIKDSTKRNVAPTVLAAVDVWIKGFYGFEHDEPDEWQ